jgi:hypothetical protein
VRGATAPGVVVGWPDATAVPVPGRPSWQNGAAAGPVGSADEMMMKQAMGESTGCVALAAQAFMEA